MKVNPTTPPSKPKSGPGSRGGRGSRSGRSGGRGSGRGSASGTKDALFDKEPAPNPAEKAKDVPGASDELLGEDPMGKIDEKGTDDDDTASVTSSVVVEVPAPAAAAPAAKKMSAKTAGKQRAQLPSANTRRAAPRVWADDSETE